MFEKENLQGVGIGRPYGAAAAALDTLIAAGRRLSGRRQPSGSAQSR